MATYVTSDQHWGHANVLAYCGRKFDSIGAHDAELIKAWNDLIGEDDEVYHLGDVTLGNVKFASSIFQQLNGLIRVLGYPWHHDARWIKAPMYSSQGKVEIVKPVVVIERIANVGEQWLPVVLCHYPFEIWDRKHYGAIHLHGHSHGGLTARHNRLDVGVDMAYKLLGRYRPFHLDEAVYIASSFMEARLIG